MKNWIRFHYGHWLSTNHNPPQWQEQGIVYIDPNTITHVATINNIPNGCIIYVNSDKNYITVNKNITEVMQEIQYNLK